MKKLLLETSFSKIYMIVMIIITLLILGGYFSYAMFTVSKEKSNAISIVTGNLIYTLTIDDIESNKLTVPSNSVKDFKVVLSNPNNRVARFNFYYLDDLPASTKIGYINEEKTNILPTDKGINLEKTGTTGSSNTYVIRVINNSGSSVTINLGVSVGLDYNDLALPSNGHLFEEITHKGEIGTVTLSNISKDNIYNDEVDTFTTGQFPNNYLWYSGKLWRIVSVNNEEKTAKLVTQWDISVIPYSKDNTDFAGSYMEDWLNDMTVDGFLYNLRDVDNFIVTNAKWNATMDSSSLGNVKRPSDSGTIVTDTVGLLNLYEYQMSFKGTTYSDGYLNNGLHWWIITPYSDMSMNEIDNLGNSNYFDNTQALGVRPSINLKSDVKIVDGNGTVDNPYRLEGDNDKDLNGVKLNTRYSGEYVKFGTGNNNLYRIVSHEVNNLTKITSAISLKDSETFKVSAFGDDTSFSNTNTIGSFLNGDYLTNYVGNNYSAMIEEDTTWYRGWVGDSGVSYKLAKYTDETGNTLTSDTASSKVGLLRLGELMAGQFDRYENNTSYWLITPNDLAVMRRLGQYGSSYNVAPTTTNTIKPTLNLKENVIITGGTGTKLDPFTIELG